ncbi:formylglycine-generating enzyme family protein [Flavobacterium agricola]|uniref:Formylglycine-generating enzyme family protein n=1 Tax=Flavobacterium agricola TaxID=2870839 RepID=A0ABY6LYC2_9FLAO|nr:formylglycine-generating enzyme family protein [Flavobacterium agricola]UYW00420.1 formylglycine-generating enzyme family protein [Flavobacterium agricola]
MKNLYFNLLFLVVCVTTNGFAQKFTTFKPEMILVEGGTFLMGSKKGEPHAEKDEMEAREVSVPSFEMSKYEVTVYEWSTFIKAHKNMKMPPAQRWGLHDDFPITNVTWEDAIWFCNWLSTKNFLQPVYSIKNGQIFCDFTKNGYRLPTEAEWEYAARGGNASKGHPYAGNKNLDLIAWYGKNSNKSPRTVGTKMPNELGLYDMTGNVWEWCWDYYNELYYSYGEDDNPKGPEKGVNRVLRGGSWDTMGPYLRIANRSGVPQTDANGYYGVRVVKNSKK